MVLSIIVTHYNEPWSMCRDLFDSIKLQRGVDLNEIEVIIANDGHDKLPIDATDYPFEIRMVEHSHAGVSATRNLGLDNAVGDYVMFCDCDDMFMNEYGLYLVFKAVEKNPDVINCDFYEENIEDGKTKLVPHGMDGTFVHGKAFRRNFLIDENIRFDPELTIHEDGYFVYLAIAVTDAVQHIKTPYYLWKWNPNSVVRSDAEDFVLKTYPDLMEARKRELRQLEERGEIEMYHNTLCKTVFDSYFDFNKASYNKAENKPWREKAEKAFKKLYDEFKEDYLAYDVESKLTLFDSARANARKNGFAIERITLRDWIAQIQRL